MSDAPTLRRLLLALILVGAVGLFAELLLLGHFEDWQQWIPLALLVAITAAAGVAFGRSTPHTLRALQVISVLCVVAGVIGMWLHFAGNVEWEREQDEAIGGTTLFWAALTGATPALAPGALAQLGLLGLVYAFRHPALRDARGAGPHHTSQP